MKKILFLILILASVQASAQTMKDIVRTMPDSITPLLTKNMKLDFIDYLDAGQKAVEKNKFGGQSEMLKINDTRAIIQMTKSSIMDIKLLKNAEAPIGIISTAISGSTCTSIIKYYTLDWKPVKTVLPTDFNKLEWADDNEEIKSTSFSPLEVKTEKLSK